MSFTLLGALFGGLGALFVMWLSDNEERVWLLLMGVNNMISVILIILLVLIFNNYIWDID